MTLITARDYIEVAEIPLPDLVGLDFDQAAIVLEQADLVPVPFAEYNRNAPVNAVTSQAPAAGTIVRQGRTVSLGINTPPQDSRAPVLISRTAEDALQLAREQNLNLGQIEYEHNANAPAGIVISQTPEPGEPVDPLQGLRIVVSRGPELPPVSMPDMRGRMLDDAEQALRQMGFVQIVRVATGTTGSRPGSVISQQPPPGEVVERATPVTLGYGLDSSVVVTVPTVAGQSAVIAQQRLRNAGLSVGAIEYVQDPNVVSGTVVSSRPSAGSYTLSGSPVSLVVNGTTPIDVPVQEEVVVTPGAPTTPGTPLFPEGEFGSRTIPFSFNPADHRIDALMSQSYRLSLEVEDERGVRTVYDSTVPAGEAVNTTVTIFGDAMLKMFINDILYMAWAP